MHACTLMHWCCKGLLLNRVRFQPLNIDVTIFWVFRFPEWHKFPCPIAMKHPKCALLSWVARLVTSRECLSSRWGPFIRTGLLSFDWQHPILICNRYSILMNSTNTWDQVFGNLKKLNLIFILQKPSKSMIQYQNMYMIGH